MVSILAAMEIQGNLENIRCEAYDNLEQPPKWSGAINLYRDGAYHKRIFSSGPVYDSKEEAVEAMQWWVDMISRVSIP